jgi:hypothetical protein
MIAAAWKEIQTSPVASLGALAGAASLAVALWDAPPTAPAELNQMATTGATVTFAKLALLVPGVAFFFAFLGMLFVAGGAWRGTLMAVVLLFAASVCNCAIVVLHLSPFVSSGGQLIYGVPIDGIAYVTYVMTIVVFVGVVGEALLSRDTVRRSWTRLGHEFGPLLFFPLILLVGLAIVGAEICAIILRSGLLGHA